MDERSRAPRGRVDCNQGVLYAVDRHLVVAPLVGAWIEISVILYFDKIILSRPSWARGLKSSASRALQGQATSRPSWARGLKW